MALQSSALHLPFYNFVLACQLKNPFVTLNSLVVEANMSIFASLLFFFSLAGSAMANGVPAPGPEMSAGIVSMTLAAGVVYLIKRRKRS